MTLTQIVPIFVSAFLGIFSGIVLEHYRGRRERSKLRKERERSELLQINGVIVGIGFNVESLIHLLFQNILPHYEQSHAAYKELYASINDPIKLSNFTLTLGAKYPALMMTCPELHFREFDFLEKLPFLIESDAELVKKAGWLVNHSRLLHNAIVDQNAGILEARSAIAQTGGLNFHQLDGILQLQENIGFGECAYAYQLLQNLLAIAASLQSIATEHPGIGGRKKVVPPPALQDALQKLGVIVASRQAANEKDA